VTVNLFDPDHIVGVFRGFSESGLEFHADLVMPYRDEFQSTPMHGQFVLVQLENERQAVLGRVTTIAAQGRLVSPIGEDYAVRAVRDQRPIPDELRDQYLKYKVNIRVLGVVRTEGDKLLFVPSHRRLPHVGAPVAFLSPAVLAEIANATDDADDAAELGFLALGEFVYADEDPRATLEPWIVSKSPAIMPRFQISKLISRRSFVFARAGFGKSNLVKLLFATLYGKGKPPTVPRRENREDPVGTLIFDPDGEYFWPDPRGRPALCDVEALDDRLVVFTNRQAPSPLYQSFVFGKVKLDIRDVPAARVLGIALSAERQDQQNVLKLKGLSSEKWRRLVDFIYPFVKHGSTTELYANTKAIREIVGFAQNDEVQIPAAISNVVWVIRELHDPASQLLRALKKALGDGCLCVVDISQMRGAQGLRLAGIILSDIFEHNQIQFTAANPKTIPTIAVIEEAQSVLSGSTQQDDGPFVSWVKEGRKYDLGALLITQQPGSIPLELLSQGDNFFVFHLLSQGDLAALKRANAHFSDDLLATLLNEPLVGHGIFWSSAPGLNEHAKPYPLSVRVLDFNRAYQCRDPENNGAALDDIYAARLRSAFTGALEKATHAVSAGTPTPAPDTKQPVDAEQTYRRAAIQSLGNSDEFRESMSTDGMWWWRVAQLIEEFAPPEDVVGNQWEWARGLVKTALVELLGAQDVAWASEPRQRGEGRTNAWVKPLTPARRPQPPPPPEPDEPPF
jgi:hypothetical protein